ncbi:ribose 5-phosphate isomerase B [Bdellovibrionota bacterium FG-1]
MTPLKRVLIASDHAGVALKSFIQQALPGWEWEDLGPLGNGRVDYPDFAKTLSEKIVSGSATQGVLVCGSGIGMSIAANKVAGIRAAVVENPVGARLSREHNDANVLCLGSRFIAPEYGAEIVQTWLNTPFSGDPRHQARIDKITQLEKV